MEYVTDEVARHCNRVRAQKYAARDRARGFETYRRGPSWTWAIVDKSAGRGGYPTREAARVDALIHIRDTDLDVAKSKAAAKDAAATAASTDFFVVRELPWGEFGIIWTPLTSEFYPPSVSGISAATPAEAAAAAEKLLEEV